MPTTRVNLNREWTLFQNSVFNLGNANDSNKFDSLEKGAEVPCNSSKFDSLEKGAEVP
jgi:hypothetical protein